MLLRDGPVWDPRNAEDLLNYTTKNGYRIAGWELGNGKGSCKNGSAWSIGKLKVIPDSLIGHDRIDVWA